MIPEAIIGGVTAITLGSLWLADRVHKRTWALEMPVEEGDVGLDEMAEKEVSLLENERARLLIQAGKSRLDGRFTHAQDQQAAADRALSEIKRLRKHGVR